MQHQPLRDRDVHDHLPDAAQRGHAYFHLAETQSVEEPQDALHLKELAFAVFEPIIPLAFIDFLHSICLINCVCLLYETVGLGFSGLNCELMLPIFFGGIKDKEGAIMDKLTIWCLQSHERGHESSFWLSLNSYYN